MIATVSFVTLFSAGAKIKMYYLLSGEVYGFKPEYANQNIAFAAPSISVLSDSLERTMSRSI